VCAYRMEYSHRNRDQIRGCQRGRKLRGGGSRGNGVNCMVMNGN